MKNAEDMAGYFGCVLTEATSDRNGISINVLLALDEDMIPE